MFILTEVYYIKIDRRRCFEDDKQIEMKNGVFSIFRCLKS